MDESSPPHLNEALRQHFGFEAFRPGQREVIEHLVAGRSAAAVFPTGSGKSLCYQLPALLLDGLTVVVSPLIALMKDQIDALERRGIIAVRLDSSLGPAEYREAMDRLRSGRARLLYVAPERFNNERFRGMLAHLDIALFAVDEAHCVSEWGHNFRPDYLKLARFAREAGARVRLGLTATATAQVLADVCEGLEIAPECAVRTGFYRPNLELRTSLTPQAQREDVLLQRLAERPRGGTIVYVTQQRTAERIAQRLDAAGYDVHHYHAGLNPEQRSETQNWFMQSSDGIVVATIAFGMGVDKADIRYVYHFDLPKSLEGYAQEIGRAGRDSDKAVCELLAGEDDVRVLENFAYGDTPDPEDVTALVRHLFDQGSQFDVSLYELSAAHDVRILVVKTLLTYLELDGYLRGGTPFYSSYKFEPLHSSKEILSRFDAEYGAFLRGIFTQVKKGRKWLSLDAEAAARNLGCDRNAIVRALDDLAERGLAQVKAERVRLRFEVATRPDSVDAVADDLGRRMQAREAGEIGRVREVLQWARLETCQVAALCERFEQKLPEDCGHCSACLGDPRPPVPERPGVIDEARWAGIVAAREECGEVLARPRALARFACGIRSPRLTKAKLTRDARFGSLESAPFEEVLARAH